LGGQNFDQDEYERTLDSSCGVNVKVKIDSMLTVKTKTTNTFSGWWFWLIWRWGPQSVLLVRRVYFYQSEQV
jgi:hypothetical protein